jgi:hypothetical protein
MQMATILQQHQASPSLSFALQFTRRHHCVACSTISRHVFGRLIAVLRLRRAAARASCAGECRGTQRRDTRRRLLRQFRMMLFLPQRLQAKADSDSKLLQDMNERLLQVCALLPLFFSFAFMSE